MRHVSQVAHSVLRPSGMVKVKVTLQRAIKVQRGEYSYSSILFLTAALDRVGGQPPSPVAMPPGKRSDTHCTGGWVGPRAGLDRCGKSRPQRDSIPGPSSP